jgi:hypothetical protein
VCVCVCVCIYTHIYMYIKYIYIYIYVYKIKIQMLSLTSCITKYVAMCYPAQYILSVNPCSTSVKVENLFDGQ